MYSTGGRGLARLRGSTLRLRHLAEVRPLDYIRWTPPQAEFLGSTRDSKLLRCGNQFGKTWAGAADAILFALGDSRFRPMPELPTYQWVVCNSWKQSRAIQRKIWNLLPKDQITKETRFSTRNGFVGTQKVVEFLCGSFIEVKTIGQEDMDLASETLHRVWVDEPLGDEDTFSELQMRLRRTGGELAITMTPASAGDLAWLRALAKDDRIADLHHRMEAKNFVPVGTSRPLCTENGVPMDAAWVQQQIDECLPYARPVRCHGEWEFAAVDRVFPAFDEKKHVVKDLLRSDARPPAGANVELCLGIDYGEDRLRTCAVYCYTDIHPKTGHPRVWVVGTYVPDKATTPEMDARSIISMLASLGDRWTDLDFAHGDKKYTDASGHKIKKSNGQMLEAIEKELRVDGGLRPIIKGAKKGAGAGRGSVYAGVRWLHNAMIRPGHLFIDASLEWLIESIGKWDLTEKSKHKDVLDALRYSLKHLIFPKRIHQPRSYIRRS